jgi:two-component system response regulator RegA
MANCHGNISKAAALLGVHRQSLQRKLRKFTPRQ